MCILSLLIRYIHKVCTQVGGGGGVSKKHTSTIKSSNFPIQPAYKGGGGLIMVIFVHTYLMDGPYRHIKKSGKNGMKWDISYHPTLRAKYTKISFS